ncbi:MAG TPA: hypothetical protein VFG20_05275 [Planctomycetaceae bacterium]|jgi:hypothetical protein|nr:hypothetical protein [Planctomycetaceae bacterium]
MTLPTRDEINVFDSLDERVACRNFLGKTLNDAEALFRDNALFFSEDLMWMGPVAFGFYVPAYISYLESDAANHDADAVNCFLGVLQYRVEHYASDLIPIAAQLAAACRYVLDHYDKFEFILEIDGDLHHRLLSLEKKLQELTHTGG